MSAPTSLTIPLNAEQQEQLCDVLRGGNYRLVQVPHARIAAESERCRIALFGKSGKCLVQGKGASEFVEFVLEPHVLGEARLGYETVIDPRVAEAHMGVDESGKGDYFGPMIIAAAYVDADLCEKLREMDVKDSKRYTSEKRLLEVAAGLRRLLGRRFSIVPIGPAAYNRLYRQMRSVNAILAWGHARAIENLLEAVPDCPRAISDQFGNASQVKKALMQKGRGIELEQRPRAESDPAVAAASILARAAFVYAIKKLEELYGVPFKKGASAAVRESAVRLVAAYGPEILVKTAKCHFRTTDMVLEEAGSHRSVLGPDGQAVSKPVDRSRFQRPKTVKAEKN